MIGLALLGAAIRASAPHIPDEIGDSCRNLIPRARTA